MTRRKRETDAELFERDQTEMKARYRADAFENGSAREMLKHWIYDGEPTDAELRSIVRNILSRLAEM